MICKLVFYYYFLCKKAYQIYFEYLILILKVFFSLITFLLVRQRDNKTPAGLYIFFAPRFIILTRLKPPRWYRLRKPSRNAGVIPAAVAVPFIAAILSAQTAVAQPNKELNNYVNIHNLIQSGKLEEANKKIIQTTQNYQKSAELRYFQCLIFTKQNAIPNAISCFSELVKSQPDMIEAYNNLAVLHASLGQDEQARLWLDKGMARVPAAETLHQNILNLQASMARKAYSKALQVEVPLRDSMPRLTLLASIPSTAYARLQLQESNTSTQTETAKVLDGSKPLTEGKNSSASPETSFAQADIRPVRKLVNPSASARPTLEETSQTASDHALRQQVQKSIESWAQAWSEKNISEYFSSYSKEFSAGKGFSREQWEEERRSRIINRKFIQIHLRNFSFEIGKEKIISRFTQFYESDSINTINRKKLELILEDGQWKISRETVISN